MRKSADILFRRRLPVFFLIFSAFYVMRGYCDEYYFGKEDFTLHKVFLLIEGNTKPGALRSFLNIKEGQEFVSLEDLKTTLEEEKQALVDRQYYSKVEYILEGNPKIGYIVTFLVEEETPFIPVPVQGYKTRNGRETGDEGYYDNAFGTMTDWDMSLYAQVNSKGVIDWQVRQRVRKLRIGDRVFAFYLAQTHDNIYFEEYGKVLGDYSVDKTKAGFSTEIELDNDLTYDLSPAVAVRYNYEDYGGAKQYDEVPVEFSLDHKMFRELIEWEGNGRNGYRAEVFNNISIDQTVDEGVRWKYYTVFGTSGSIYWVPWKYLSLYSNITLSYGFQKNSPMQGDRIRGVLDNRIYGNKSVFFRNTAGLDLFRWPGAVNLQLHPFIDMGTSASQWDPFHELYVGAGMDTVVFLDFLSDFAIRLSAGLDIGELVANDRRRWEVTVQTGLAY